MSCETRKRRCGTWSTSRRGEPRSTLACFRQPLTRSSFRPSWGEEIRAVWARRTPYFESLCTHTIVSLTAYPPPPSPQFLMKHVETAFVRLLRSIFGFASSHVPLVAGPRPAPASGPSSGEYGGYGACESVLGRGAKGSRTSFVALNFPDLRIVGAETIRKVAGGVDVIEMRVDTLVEVEQVPPFSRIGSPANGDGSSAPTPRRRRYPSPHFVAMSFGHLRRCSPLPILYTVRTEKQGGAFPDPYIDNPDLFSDYVALVELGFKLGAEYVDVELALPDDEIQRFLGLRGAATQVLGADHDRKGEWRWDSQEVLDKYLRAARLGCDVIKLVSTPTTFDSNLELLKFRAKVDALTSEETGADRPIPLLAINLGKGGQISRYLNPVLTPVTHPLLPGVAAPGQLTFAQTQQALYLSGLTLEKTFFVSSASVAETFSREAHTLGLPYNFLVEDRLAMRASEPDFGGAYLGAPSAPLAVSSISYPDELLPPAASCGWADLCVPVYTEPDSYDVPPSPLGYYKHTNVRVLALAEVITQNLSPINAVGTHTCALLVGLAKRDRSEVVEALRMVGARWVFLLACEGDEADPAGSSALATPSRPASPRPPSRPATPSGPQPHTNSSLPYPQHAPLQLLHIPSFSAPLLYSKRPPTIIVSSDDLLAPRSTASSAISSPSPFPENLFSSPTGGCALDLSLTSPLSTLATAATSSPRRGLLAHAIEAKRARARGAHVNGKGGVHAVVDGWQVLGVKDVQSECERQAFRALTGRRMG